VNTSAPPPSLTPSADATTVGRRAPGLTIYFSIGFGAAVIGLLPWLLVGVLRPLVYLGGIDSGAGAMSHALLPFSEYALILVAGMFVVGSALAGGVMRALHTTSPRFALLATMSGVLVVQVGATVQTAVIAVHDLQLSWTPSTYLTALVLFVIEIVVSISLGLVVLRLIAASRVPGAMVGISLAAVSLGPWIAGFTVPFSTSDIDLLAQNVVVWNIAHWTPAVVMGLAMAWSRFTTRGRSVATVAALFMLWLGPSLLTAMGAAAGTRVLANRPSEMVEYGAQVLWSVLLSSAMLLPLVVALVVMGGAVGIGWMTRRRTSPPAEAVS
jgi:hypothetical protein